MDFYSFTAKDIDGNERKMSEFEEKVVIVVNTASKCGLTPQFEELENIYQKYKDKGLVVLGFPCGQFAGQELATEDEISSFCELNYGVTFPMFAKIKVNGDDAHPIFKYLREEKSGTFGNKIKWNFTKFLLDKNGKVVERYAPTTSPEKMTSDIEKLL